MFKFIKSFIGHRNQKLNEAVYIIDSDITESVTEEQGGVPIKFIIYDGETKEAIEGAAVKITGEKTFGGLTSKNGEVTINIRAGTYTFEFKMVGYESQIIKKRKVKKVETIKIKLKSRPVDVSGVTIEARRDWSVFFSGQSWFKIKAFSKDFQNKVAMFMVGLVRKEQSKIPTTSDGWMKLLQGKYGKNFDKIVCPFARKYQLGFKPTKTRKGELGMLIKTDGWTNYRATFSYQRNVVWKPNKEELEKKYGVDQYNVNLLIWVYETFFYQMTVDGSQNIDVLRSVLINSIEFEDVNPNPTEADPYEGSLMIINFEFVKTLFEKVESTTIENLLNKIGSK
jgi:hypothetical protein